MKQGFTLIEILIATAIASIMSAMLLVSVSQMNRSYARLDAWTHLYYRAMSIQNRLERDLMGAFIKPHDPKEEEKEKKRGCKKRYR